MIWDTGYGIPDTGYRILGTGMAVGIAIWYTYSLCQTAKIRTQTIQSCREPEDAVTGTTPEFAESR